MCGGGNVQIPFNVSVSDLQRLFQLSSYEAFSIDGQWLYGSYRYYIRLVAAPCMGMRGEVCCACYYLLYY